MLSGLREVGKGDRPGDEAPCRCRRGPFEPAGRGVERGGELEKEVREEQQDDEERPLRDDLEVRVGRLRKDLSRKSDRAERAEAQRRPEARAVAAVEPVPKREEAEQPEGCRADVAQDVVDGFGGHASTDAIETVISGGLSRTRVTDVERQRTRHRPRLDAHRRETPGPYRSGSNESWRPRELGARYHSSSPPDGPSTTQGQILIVDDESAIRLVCRLNLRTAGFDTLEASDGASALALARAERPDLILLDIMLPEVDGWRVAEELAADPETRDIPILFLTARSDRTDEVKGLEVGGVGLHHQAVRSAGADRHCRQGSQSGPSRRARVDPP